MSKLAQNLRKFKLITFDCTNTLFYFKKPPHLHYIDTAVSFGLPEKSFDRDLIKHNFRKQFKEMSLKYPNYGCHSIRYPNWWKHFVINVLVQSSHGTIEDIFIEPVALKLFEQYQTDECCAKFEQANELIAALKEAGKVVGVISNYDPRLHNLIKNMELPELDFVLTSYEAEVEKPDPKIFQKAIEASKLKISPSEALHIGNELEKDFNGARDAGWSSVLINSEADIQRSFEDIKTFFDVITNDDVEL